MLGSMKRISVCWMRHILYFSVTLWKQSTFAEWAHGQISVFNFPKQVIYVSYVQTSSECRNVWLAWCRYEPTDSWCMRYRSILPSAPYASTGSQILPPYLWLDVRSACWEFSFPLRCLFHFFHHFLYNSDIVLEHVFLAELVLLVVS